MPLLETYLTVRYLSLIVASICFYDSGTIFSLEFRLTLKSSPTKRVLKMTDTVLLRMQPPVEKLDVEKIPFLFSFFSVSPMLLVACRLNLVVSSKKGFSVKY